MSQNEIVVTNTNKIADMCEKIRPISPEKCPPHIEGCEQTIKDIAYGKAHELYGDPLPEIIQKRLEKEQKKETFIRKNTESRMNAAADTRCDLRGMTVEEAMLDLDTFIDNILRTGLNEITIIHGKGTGALRKGIHIYLRKHPNIRTFRLGVFGEGEDGVTIAELK